MAIIYQAELRPSKLELLGGWAPSQPWFDGDATALTSVGAYRFDDPEGEVGVETMLVQAGGTATFQMPVTYRATPLPDADDWLIGTLQHSVLGTRWVYDGVGDPVYLQAVAAAIIGPRDQAELLVEIDGESVRREPTAKVVGSGVDGVTEPALPTVQEIAVQAHGTNTVVETAGLRITVVRVPDGSQTGDDSAGVLSGTWTDQPESRALVLLSPR